MAVEAHIIELRERHKVLESKIETEQSHPSSDNVKISELKRKKLLLKEEINRLKQMSN